MDAPLFWNEQGAVCCAKHAPYPKSDTWNGERWKRMTDGAVAAWTAQTGREPQCECCRAKVAA